MTRLIRGVLVVVSLVSGLVVGELLLRAADYHYSPIQIGANVKNDFREEHAFRDRNLVYDPDLIWRPLSGQFSPFNPQGFRGPLIDAVKPPGRLRIIALGDSNTFGWDVDDGANWPSQLQGLFAASRPATEVINAGVWGYTSFQGWQRFKEIVAFSPDLVLVSFGGNDAHQVTVPDSEYVKRHDRIERLTRATRRLRVAQLAVAALDRVTVLTGETGTPVSRVSLENYRSHLRDIIRLARERGIRVVLLTRPYVGSSTDPASWKTHAPLYREATLDVGRVENTPVIDVYASFQGKDAVFDDEAHFGVEGHRRAAELIHSSLQPLLQH